MMVYGIGFGAEQSSAVEIIAAPKSGKGPLRGILLHCGTGAR
jgi:hypothetical protein